MFFQSKKQVPSPRYYKFYKMKTKFGFQVRFLVQEIPQFNCFFVMKSSNIYMLQEFSLFQQVFILGSNFYKFYGSLAGLIDSLVSFPSSRMPAFLRVLEGQNSWTRLSVFLRA